MARLSFAERARLTALIADRSRRAAVSTMLQSPLLRWQFGASAADQLLIVPQDLRTADASFWSEMRLGHFGFGGRVALIDDGSPFDLKPPSPVWSRELHGFGWLRNLDAAHDGEARDAARDLVVEWIERHRVVEGIAWEPAVIGRRLISWISHASLLLEEAEHTTYDAITSSLGAQLVHLSAAWRHAAAGYPRLLALTSLVFADLCIAGHDRQLEGFEKLLADEVERQILPDGGHVSRNPGVLVELLLDFLPLNQCFAARGRQPPEVLAEAIQRMIPMLRMMRLGNGAIARFNGMGATPHDHLATVLAYGARGVGERPGGAQSGYVRLERGASILVCDVGIPPDLDLAGEAHAGCLSFEMSSGARALIVNGGAPGPADEDWRAASRATSCHNTLCVNNKSSSKLVRSRMLEAIVGAAPIRWPTKTRWKVGEPGGGLELEAFHDGYLKRFRLLHRRRLRLDPSGDRLDGFDRLGPPKGDLRLSQDLPFAVHFHLHPQVECLPLMTQGMAELRLADGERWLFTGRGAALSVEDSTHFADFSGPRRSLQIVLRGACFGASEVRWSIARLGADGEPLVPEEQLPGAEAAPGARRTPPPLPDPRR